MKQGAFAGRYLAKVVQLHERLQDDVVNGINATNATGIHANEIITVVIPDSAGVRLPFRGVPEQGGVLTAMLFKDSVHLHDRCVAGFLLMLVSLRARSSDAHRIAKIHHDSGTADCCGFIECSALRLKKPLP
jgi:hypothetical protein